MKLLFHAFPLSSAAVRAPAAAQGGGDDVDRGLAWLESALTEGLPCTPDAGDPAASFPAPAFVLMERLDLSRATAGTPHRRIASRTFAIGVHPRDARRLGIVTAHDLLDGNQRRWHDIARILNVLGRLEQIARPHEDIVATALPKGVDPIEPRLDACVEQLIRHLDRHHANRMLEFFDQAGERASVLEAMVRSLLTFGGTAAIDPLPGAAPEYRMIPAWREDESATAAADAAPPRAIEGSRLRDCIVEIVVPGPALERARRLVARLPFAATPPRVHAAPPTWDLREFGDRLQVVAWKPPGDGRR